MIHLFFLFKWSFWHEFFTVIGIIFCLYLLVIALMMWVIGLDNCFHSGSLDRNQVGNQFDNPSKRRHDKLD